MPPLFPGRHPAAPPRSRHPLLLPNAFDTSGSCSAHRFGNGGFSGEEGGFEENASLRDATTRHPRSDDGRLAAHRGQNACPSPRPVPKTRKSWEVEGVGFGEGEEEAFLQKGSSSPPPKENPPPTISSHRHTTRWPAQGAWWRGWRGRAGL